MADLSLVYHTGGLGDFITTLPAIKAWNKRNTNSRKILLGKPSYGILGIHEGLFDEIWDVESQLWSWIYSRSMPVPPQLQEKIQSIQSALLFTSNDSPVLARFKAYEIKNLLFQDPFPTKRIHVSAYHLSLIGKELKKSGQYYLAIRPHPDFKNEADTYLAEIGKLVVISPGSGSEKKNWPFERFMELADKLSAQGYECLWILGPAEGAFPVPETGRVIRNSSLPVLVHVLSQSALYIGNDSGISHLAAACGAPCVVLFGPSDPDVWRPAGKNVVVVAAGRKGCFPCHRSFSSGIGDKSPPQPCAESCMKDISVQSVFETCDRILRKV